MSFKLQPKIYSLSPEETVDSLLEKLVSLFALPFAIETVTITKTNIKAEIWMPDQEPPYGDLPLEKPVDIPALLSRVSMIELTEESTLNADALGTMAGLLIQARANKLSGVAWLVGSLSHFCMWINVKPTPVKFLEIPLIETSSIPAERIVLLCGCSSKLTPLDANTAVLGWMGDQHA